MTTLDNLARKIDSFEPVDITETEKDITEYMELIKARLRNIEQNISKHENRIKDICEAFNQTNFDLADKSEVQSSLIKLGSFITEILQHYQAMVRYTKQDEEFKVIIEYFSPGILSRIEDMIGDYEDILENLNLSVECPDELEEVEKLAKEYAKKAPVADWD